MDMLELWSQLLINFVQFNNSTVLLPYCIIHLIIYHFLPLQRLHLQLINSFICLHQPCLQITHQPLHNYSSTLPCINLILQLKYQIILQLKLLLNAPIMLISYSSIKLLQILNMLF